LGDRLPPAVLAVLASVLIALPCSALIKQEAELAEGPSLEAEEKARDAADRSDKASDKAVRMLDRLIIKSRAKASDPPRSAADSWLTAKTKLAVAADERVKGRRLMIDSKNGVVTLRGTVESEAAKAAAEEIIKGVAGVKGVKNSLQVVPPSEQDLKADSDEVITGKIVAIFKKDSKLKKAGVSVKTDAGVVTLTGLGHDVMMSAHAAWIAWQVRGVRSVKNEPALKDARAEDR
jgi:osmotically-inducible protein OsmY